MFHGRAMDRQRNRIHERALIDLFIQSNPTNIKELLEKNKAVSIKQRNFQTLATKICDAKNKISPEIVNLFLSLLIKVTILEMFQFLKVR